MRFDEVAYLTDALGCPEAMAWVLVRRGLADPDAAREFLNSDGPLSPPEAIDGIAEAADRLAQAVRSGERIVVHGDYDCDGISSTAILVRALQTRGGRVRPFLPSRFIDGYGVSLPTIERLADEGTDLLVTVDCGTTAVEAITLARDLGIATIVCDHHLAGGQRPPAIIANPALGHAVEALPAAAGVTFKLVQALASRLDGSGLAPDHEEGIDLVALATIADAVPLIGENRRLVARGLAAIHRSPRPGIAALCAAASISPRSLTARDLGWNLAPAINASGRMAHPSRALELLLAEDGPQTTLLARELWDLNMERRSVEQQVTAEAIAIIEASPAHVRDAHALVVAGEGWHEGVVGIVASRLVERFGRPAIVVTIAETGAKGSGRSLPGVDLHQLVGAASGRLERWGGHAGAIGLQLAADDIHHFRAELTLAAAAVSTSIDRARVRSVDAVVGLRDLSLASAEAFDAMQPFGTGNPDIRLVVPGALLEHAGTVGKDSQHLQVRFRAGAVHARAMGWRMGSRAAQMPVGEHVDAVVQLGIERWQDMVGPRVTLDGVDRLSSAQPATHLCLTPCNAECRLRTSPHPQQAPDIADHTTTGRPLGVRDRRRLGTVLATVVALAGADDGVCLVVADTAARRELLAGVLEPTRMGVAAAALAGGRCEVAAMRERLDALGRQPGLVMADYASLVHIELPERMHVVVVDPPCDAAQAAHLARHATGRWLHLVFGDEEVRFAGAIAEQHADLRGGAARIWRALGTRAPLSLDELAALTDTPDGAVLDPQRLRGALAALEQIGRVRIDAQGVHPVADAPTVPIAQAAAAVQATERLTLRREFLTQVMTMDFAGGAVSFEEHVRTG